MSISSTIYVSGLKAGAKPLEVCQTLCLPANPADVILDVVLQGDGAFFVVFKDSHMAAGTIQRFHKKPVFDGCGKVDGLSSETQKVLAQLKPQLFGAVSKPTAALGNETPAGGAKTSLKLSDVLEAIAGWSFEQKQQLGAALGFPPSGVATEVITPGPGHPVATQPPAAKMGGLYTPVSQPSIPVHAPPYPVLPQPVFSTPQPEQSFQFGTSNTVNNIRVSSFSGSPKDCSFEQFRYDVQCLLKQGCPEGMVLTAIKRSIRGQAQEIVLHMGEDATVADIINRYDMMFGDVNPPHVLLAQFYSAFQTPGESITDWYARLEDIASKITRKDGNVISPNNYDILVNTQFWTKMNDEKMKNALRHKFDELAGSPQFVVEARKIESEFAGQAVKLGQVHSETLPAMERGFEEILARLSTLEKEIQSNRQTQKHTEYGDHHQTGQAPHESKKNMRKPVRCFKCHKLGHIARNCPLNSRGSEKGSGPTTQ